MLHSRATLSPWGWGEYCYRDYQAIYAESVLIKPDTSFSDTWPALIPNKHYIVCKNDFSDLKDCVERSQTSEWLDRVKENRVELIEAMREESLAKRIFECFRENI
jgi:hypothetical protein